MDHDITEANSGNAKTLAQPRRGHLRLVHDDRSRARVQRAELSEAEMRMRWYAQHIRELREEEIDFSKVDFAGDRPKLTLVTKGELQ